MRRYDRQHTLTYYDPPYWQVEGYGEPFGIEEYERLAAWMGKVMVSLNDHPDMQRVFAAHAMLSVDVHYGRRGQSPQAGAGRT
ncbi:hypothetical protein [Paraburkholderia caffeinilytica]|uniref:hypothetical protein n=1 Tax=Paraburkholderia caffeinilytica TaxID=1761016 RepID=UPI003DA02CEF